jgi:hypothetical protein
MIALLAIGAGSSAESRGLPRPPRSIPAEMFVVEPTPPIDGAGICVLDSGAPGAECVFLYRAVLFGRLHRSAPGTGAWRRG